jgi:hypothetical protein
MIRPFSTLAVAAALFAMSAPAQGRLIGLTAGNTGVSPELRRQTVCSLPERVCPTGISSPAGFAGGAAYNAINRSVWHTQGTRMAEIRIGDCQLLCSAPAVLTLGPGSLASGLTISERFATLFQLESVPGAARIHALNIRSCPPEPVGVVPCTVNLPTNFHLAGALALDEKRGTFFVAASVFGAALPNNQVLVLRRDAPCAELCRFRVDTCGGTNLGAIRAMAHDTCNQRLYVSDGKDTVVFDTTNLLVGGNCNPTLLSCCVVPPGNQEWYGFDIEPNHAASVGQSCTDHNCPSCPSMRLVEGADATVGNQSYNVRVVDAPAGTFATVGIGAGACSPPGLPLFCGRWHALSLPLIFTGVFPLSGTPGQCDGTGATRIPIPFDFGLCGGTVCLQAVIACPTGDPFRLGFGLTNALDVVIGS